MAVGCCCVLIPFTLATPFKTVSHDYQIIQNKVNTTLRTSYVEDIKSKASEFKLQTNDCNKKNVKHKKKRYTKILLPTKKKINKILTVILM